MKIEKILLTITSIILFVALTSYTIFSNIELNKQIVELANKNADQSTQQNQKNTEIANEIQKHNGDILALQKDLANAEVDIISLQKYIDTTENRIRDIKTELDEKINKINIDASAQSSVQNAEIKNLLNELKKQEEQITSLKIELSEKETAIKTIVSQITIIEGRINELLRYELIINDLKDRIENLENNQKQIKKVKLTEDNYHQYIGFNVRFSNLNQTKSNTDNSKTIYTCNMEIEIYPVKPNINFENVNFGLVIKIVGDGNNTLTGCGTPLIGKDGEYQIWRIHEEQVYQHIILPESGNLTKTTQIYHIQWNYQTQLPCIYNMGAVENSLFSLTNITGTVIIEE